MKALLHRLIFGVGIEHAWKELSKQNMNKAASDSGLNVSELESGFCESLLYIVNSKYEPQKNYSKKLKVFSNKTFELADIMDEIEKDYGEIFNGMGLFHYTQADMGLLLLKGSPQYKNYEPTYKKVKISEHLRLLADAYGPMADSNMYSMSVRERQANPKRVFIIRKLAVHFHFIYGYVLRRVCAKFAGAILGEAVSLDQVNDALKRFDGQY